MFDHDYCLLDGFTGLVISAICGNENTALQVAIATFYPVLVLSGKPPLSVAHCFCVIIMGMH